MHTERGVCFEDVELSLDQGSLLDSLEHPNHEKYPGQQIVVVAIGEYAYLVPCVETENYLFLKTIIPSRKATKELLMKLTRGEKELLKSYENDEWVSTKRLDTERRRFKEYTRSALKKDKRVNIRISERDLVELQRKAVHEGLPYQTLISSVLHKFVSGRLIDRAADT
jgi:predicted DNA binding CopG/RHH family protein